jgi:hypothetical protein
MKNIRTQGKKKHKYPYILKVKYNYKTLPHYVMSDIRVRFLITLEEHVDLN